MNRIALTLFLFFGVVQSQPIPLGQWKNYTSMKSVRGLIAVDNKIWTATNGGVFVYDTSTHSFVKYNNSDRVSYNDLQTIALDKFKRVWVGGSDGSLSVFDPIGGLWAVVNDIKNVSATIRPHKAIQKFVPYGDTLFVVSQFGVSVFKLSSWEFGDTYADLGFVSAPIVNTMVIHRDRIWVGTSSGIATAPLSSQNLFAPNPWTIYPTLDTLSSSFVSSMIVFHDTLVVATPAGAAAFTNGTFHVIPSLTGLNIVNLTLQDSRLVLLSNNSPGFTIASLCEMNGQVDVVANNSSLKASAVIFSGRFFIGTTTSGIAMANGSDWIQIVPNCPNSNAFTSLAVDANGVLWAASLPLFGSGFYRYNPDLPDSLKWKNFTSVDISALKRKNAPFDNYYYVSIVKNNSVWISSWGDGVAEVRGDSVYRKLDYSSQPRLPAAVSDDSTWVVTGGVAIDQQGRTWIANLDKFKSRSLMRLDNDTSATYFDTPISSDAWFHALLIDQNDTKWMGNSDPTDIGQKGLYFLNEDNRINGTNNGWGYLSTADGLPSNTIFCVVSDLDGSVWVGTDAGAVIFPDPLNPQDRNSSYPLNGRDIQSIAVDAVNNKWVGTNQGVFVVNADGSQLLRQYSVENTNGLLVSNDIRSVAIDQNRGIVYFGTENGLSSLTIEAVQTRRDITSLSFSPNPFIIPNTSQLVIHNLVPNSSIKILTVSGALVSQFEAQGGGRALWDGRNQKGELVASGIYIVIAFNDKQNQVVSGKVAVIRK